MNNLGTVIRFTFLNQVRNKAFLIGTIIFALIITIGAHLPLIIQAFSSDEAAKVAVLPSSSQIPAQLQAFYEEQEKPEIEIILLDDQGSAKANEELAKEKLFAGDIKGYLVFPQELAGHAEYKSEDVGSSVQGKLATGLQFVKTTLAIQDIGLSEEQQQLLLTPFDLQGTQVTKNDTGKTEAEINLAYALTFIMLFMLFGASFGGGAMVATEVSAEKNSRVMEIIVTSVRPLVQMFGKIIGVCLVGLIQIAIYAAVIVINMNLPYNQDAFAQFDLDLSGLSALMLVYFLVFYIVGYLLNAVLFAAAGSIVSRSEDVGQAILPITMLSLASFYVGMFSMSDPGAGFVVVLSYIPLFTPILMIVRIGLGDPAWWEIGLSLLINIGAIILIGWLASKVYRTGILMYGKRPSIKELIKAMRYN